MYAVESPECWLVEVRLRQARGRPGRGPARRGLRGRDRRGCLPRVPLGVRRRQLDRRHRPGPGGVSGRGRAGIDERVDYRVVGKRLDVDVARFAPLPRASGALAREVSRSPIDLNPRTRRTMNHKEDAGSTWRIDAHIAGHPNRGRAGRRRWHALGRLRMQTEYFGPLARLQGRALHRPGVAAGLEVSGTIDSSDLLVSPGVAVDADGHLIALAAGGQAEVGAPRPVAVPVAGLEVLATGTKTGDFVDHGWMTRPTTRQARALAGNAHAPGQPHPKVRLQEGQRLPRRARRPGRRGARGGQAKWLDAEAAATRGLRRVTWTCTSPSMTA